MTSVFAKYEDQAYPYRYEGTLLVSTIAGGLPSNPKVAEGWIRTKITDTDERIRQLVAETMIERGITADEAAAHVDSLKHLNGFARDENGLYIELRNFMAMIKEAVSVCAAVDKLPLKGWGNTRKNIKGFVAEHICPVNDRFYLGVNEPSGVAQHFPHTFAGNGIEYVEYVTDAKIDFAIQTDWDFPEKTWAMLWLTAGRQGIGAKRSQGYGRFDVVRWERVS